MRANTVVQLRKMGREDIPAGLRLCRASRWNQLAHDWELFLAASPDGCLVAVDETGEVVASTATVRYGSVFSWVAMVLVDPMHRGAGIATRLLTQALTLIADMPTVRLDATPAGFGVYARAGFCEEYRLKRMQRSPEAFHFGSSAEGVRLMGDGDIDEVLAWDTKVFGADRGMLLDAFRHETPEYAWVSGDRAIDGYLFGRHGFAFEHLGPLVARDEAAARRLVAACLSAYPNRPFIVDVPLHDSWIGWLESLNFTEQRPFIRMYRGDRNYRDRPNQTFAITGPEFG